MKSKQWTRAALLLSLVGVALLLTCRGMLLRNHRALSEATRPLFYQIHTNDWGWRYLRPELAVLDSAENTLFIDEPTNTLVLVLCNAVLFPHINIYRARASVSQATLLPGTPCQVDVEATKDQLLVIAAPDGPRQAFQLSKGEAIKVIENEWGKYIYSTEEPLDLVQFIQRAYPGPEGSELVAFLCSLKDAGFVRGAVGSSQPSSRPTRHDQTKRAETNGRESPE